MPQEAARWGGLWAPILWGSVGVSLTAESGEGLQMRAAAHGFVAGQGVGWGWGGELPGLEHASDFLDTTRPSHPFLSEVPGYSIHVQQDSGLGALRLSCRGTAMVGPGVGACGGGGESDPNSVPHRRSGASLPWQLFASTC